MTRAGLALAAAIAAIAAPGAARADEDRVTLGFRGGVMVRDDHGYADHASAFGLGNPGVGGGGVVEAGVRVAPRLWLYASWGGFVSGAVRRLGELGVTNQALLAQVGVTVLRFDDLAPAAQLPLSLRADVLAGGGLYTVRDDLEGAGQRASGPGARGGVQVTLSWRAVGFTLAYGYHFTRASVEDRIGGALRAGGNEIGAGFSLAF